MLVHAWVCAGAALGRRAGSARRLHLQTSSAAATLPARGSPRAGPINCCEGSTRLEDLVRGQGPGCYIPMGDRTAFVLTPEQPHERGYDANLRRFLFRHVGLATNVRGRASRPYFENAVIDIQWRVNLDEESLHRRCAEDLPYAERRRSPTRSQGDHSEGAVYALSR